MKGFIIFEDFNHFITCKEILDGDYNCVISDYPNGTFSGIINRVTGASCTPKDTYDFETGALIALMNMCGLEKSAKAYAEIFGDTAYGDALIERDKLKNKLQETTDCLNDLCKRYDVVVSYCDSLREANKGLQEEAKRLKGESENHWKKYQRNIQKKQDRINELEAQIKASEDDKQKNIEYYEKEIKNLNYRLTCKDVSLEAKDKKISIYEKRILALEAENYKLKTDCEKLQHGYVDTNMMFCGGRTCGKQYTFLRNLFKWIPMDKVEAAYKEAYNTNLPLWQKEVLKQMYEIHEESTKEKTIKRNDQLDSLIEGNKYADKWIKPPTKREEMWAEIFALHKESDVVIKVKKEDVNTFLHEIEKRIPEITWASTIKIFETKHTIDDIYEELKTYNMIYFRLWKENKLSFTSDSHIYPYRELKEIPYLPPMRWDLFKKGRLVVGVRKEHYDEFISNATEHIYRFNKHKPYDNFNYSFFIYDKNANFIEAIGRSQFRQIKEMNNHKVYYWEDVR